MLAIYSKDTATITRNTLDKWGEPTGTPQTIPVMGRFELHTKIIRDIAGDEVVSTSRFLCGVPILYGDIITIDGVVYKLVSIERPKTFTQGHYVANFA